MAGSNITDCVQQKAVWGQKADLQNLVQALRFFSYTPTASFIHKNTFLPTFIIPKEYKINQNTTKSSCGCLFTALNKIYVRLPIKQAWTSNT